MDSGGGSGNLRVLASVERVSRVGDASGGILTTSREATCLLAGLPQLLPISEPTSLVFALIL